MEKSERFGLVLSSVEKSAGIQLAEAEGGLSLAALIRRLIRAEAHRRGLWPTAGRAQLHANRRPEGNDDS